MLPKLRKLCKELGQAYLRQVDLRVALGKARERGGSETLLRVLLNLANIDVLRLADAVRREKIAEGLQVLS